MLGISVLGRACTSAVLVLNRAKPAKFQAVKRRRKNQKTELWICELGFQNNTIHNSKKIGPKNHGQYLKTIVSAVRLLDYGPVFAQYLLSKTRIHRRIVKSIRGRETIRNDTFGDPPISCTYVLPSKYRAKTVLRPFGDGSL